jgi:site-specific DNA recombinase
MPSRYKKGKEPPRTFQPGDKVAGYFRDSGGGKQDRSVDEQINEWREECGERGLIPFKQFSDRAKSATTAQGRSALRAMVDYFVSGQADDDGVRGLYVWMYNRFARNEDDFAFFIATIRRAGYVVKSLKDQIPEGEFERVFEAVVSWKDAQYSRDLSRHIKRGQKHILNNYREDGGLYEIKLPDGTIRKVQLSGGGAPPLGYERIKVETGKDRAGEPRHNSYWWKTNDEDLARRITLAWELAVKGASYAEIHQECNLHNSSNSYGVMFRSLTYTGTYYYGGFERENAFEAYVSRADFDRLQERLNKREYEYQEVGMGNSKKLVKSKPALPTLHRYLLSGMVICGFCGQPFHGSRNSKEGRENIYYYECASKPKHTTCNAAARKVRADMLEPLALEAVLEVLNEDSVLSIARKLLEQQNEQLLRSQDDFDRLDAAITGDTKTIRRLALQLSSGEAAELEIEDDIRSLIKQATTRRAAAQQELDYLRQEVGDRVRGEMVVRQHELELMRRFLQTFKDDGRASGEMVEEDPDEAERVTYAHDILRALKIKMMLYLEQGERKEDGLARIALTLDVTPLVEFIDDGNIDGNGGESGGGKPPAKRPTTPDIGKIHGMSGIITNDPGGTRTPDAGLRKPSLCPTELQGQARNMPHLTPKYYHNDGAQSRIF